jgi:DNA-binding transcriptional LysR family regulator
MSASASSSSARSADEAIKRAERDIIDHLLLGSETRPGNWAEWLERAGLPHPAEQRPRVFDHFFVTLQAFVDGLGFGIGPLPVLQADVARRVRLSPLRSHVCETDNDDPDIF